MSKRRTRSPLDEVIAEVEAADREETKRAASTALVPVAGEITLSVINAKIALNATRGWISDAADILGIPAIVLDKFIKGHKELKDIVSDYRFREKEKVKQNLTEWMLAKDYAATLQLAHFDQRKEEAEANRPKPMQKDLSFDELEAAKRDVLEQIIKLFTHEQVLKLLENKTTH